MSGPSPIPSALASSHGSIRPVKRDSGAVGAEHGRGLRGGQVAGQVVDEPAVAVAENHQAVGMGARHGADAVVVRLPMQHRAVGQPDTEARATEMQVFAGHCQLAPRHGFPALVGRLAIHERLGPVIGEMPARGRHAGDGRRRLRRQLAQAVLHVVKEPHQLL